MKISFILHKAKSIPNGRYHDLPDGIIVLQQPDLVEMMPLTKGSRQARGAGRKRRERNFRPLPRPMDGSNSAIGGYLTQAQALGASSSKVCSQKNPWRVRLRQGYASRRSSRLTNAIRYLRSGHGVIASGVHADTLKAPHPSSVHHPLLTSA